MPTHSGRFASNAGNAVPNSPVREMRMQLEPDTNRRHRRLEFRADQIMPRTDPLSSPRIRMIALPFARTRLMVELGSRCVRVSSILLVLVFGQATFAASRGYLNTVGPAPLRFDNSKSSVDGPTLMQPYVPGLLNPDPNAAATGPATEPGAAPTSHPVEPRHPPQTDPPNAQGGALEPDDQTLRMETASRSDPDPIPRPDQAAKDESDPGAMEPEYQATPLTPQMLLHFFERRSGASGESESGILIPMIFTPPPAPPHHSSKATYQRSFE